MVLLGHNGAGKTTLINYLLGFYTDCRQHPYLLTFKAFVERKGLELGHYAFTPEGAFLDYEWNASDYFKLMASIHNIKAYEPDALLQKVALAVDPKKPIKHYSKGMKQRLMLALALLPEPETIVMDEPTSGLDPYGKAAIEDLITELGRSHRLILSTHSLDLAERLEDEVCILRKGEVVYEGEVSDRQMLDSLVMRYRPEQIQ